MNRENIALNFFFLLKDKRERKSWKNKCKKKEKENRKKRISGVKEFRKISFLFLVFLLYWKKDSLRDLEERYFKLRFGKMCVHKKLAKNFDQFRSTKGPKKIWLKSILSRGDLDSRILNKIQVYLNEEFFLVSTYLNWNFWNYIKYKIIT